MWLGVTAGLGAGAIWGLIFVAPLMLSQYKMVDITVGRSIAYGLLALSLMLITRGTRWPNARQFLMAMWMSVLGFNGYFLLVAWGVRDAGVAVPTLITGTIPIWIMLLGKPKDLRWAALVPGLLLTTVGIGLMTWSSLNGGAVHSADSPTTGHFWRGVLLTLLSMAGWTLYALQNVKWLDAHPEVRATDWANWLGLATGLSGVILGLSLGSPWATVQAQSQFPLFVALCVAMGLGASWLATVLWNIASRRLSASLCGQLVVGETLFALVYSFLWDGQWPSVLQMAAALLFVLGILASIRAHQDTGGGAH